MEALYAECPYCLDLVTAVEALKTAARRTNAKLSGYPCGAEAGSESPTLYVESFRVQCDGCFGLRKILTEDGKSLLSILKAMKANER